MRMTPTMEHLSAWRESVNSLLSIEPGHEPSEELAEQALDLLAVLAIAWQNEAGLMEASLAPLSEELRRGLGERALQESKQLIAEITEALGEIGVDQTLLARMPSWTRAPMEAVEAQEALVRAALAREKFEGLRLLSAPLGFDSPRLDVALSERLNDLVGHAPALLGTLSPFASLRPEGGAPRPWLEAGARMKVERDRGDEGEMNHEAGEQAADKETTKAIQMWLARRLKEGAGALRLRPGEARALLSTETGAQLAELLGESLDLSAAAEEVEAEPVRFDDTRRALRGQMFSAARVRREREQERYSASVWSLQRAAATAPQPLQWGARALIWARPVEAWLLEDRGLLVVFTRLPVEAPSGAEGERFDPALVLVSVAGLSALEVGGHRLPGDLAGQRAVCLRIDDPRQLPTLSLGGDALDLSDKSPSSDLVWVWLKLVYDGELEMAEAQLEILQELTSAGGEAEALLAVLAELSAQLSDS